VLGMGHVHSKNFVFRDLKVGRIWRQWGLEGRGGGGCREWEVVGVVVGVGVGWSFFFSFSILCKGCIFKYWFQLISFSICLSACVFLFSVVCLFACFLMQTNTSKA
jgi:hypothetical protein